MWSLGLSSTGMRDTLSFVKGHCFLARKGESTATDITKDQAVKLLEQEAEFRRQRSILALQQADGASKIEYILAVNFSYLRRVTRIIHEITTSGQK